MNALKHHLGPRWKTCTTISSSLDRDLETTLSLLRKASVARNTWGSLSVGCCKYTACQVHFRMIISSFCFYLWFARSSKQSPGQRLYSHRGGSPKEGGWLPSALCRMSGQAQDALGKAETFWNHQMGRTVKREGPFPQDLC